MSDADTCQAGPHLAGSAPQFCDSCRDHLADNGVIELLREVFIRKFFEVTA